MRPQVGFCACQVKSPIGRRSKRSSSPNIATFNEIFVIWVHYKRALPWHGNYRVFRRALVIGHGVHLQLTIIVSVGLKQWRENTISIVATSIELRDSHVMVKMTSRALVPRLGLVRTLNRVGASLQ